MSEFDELVDRIFSKRYGDSEPMPEIKDGVQVTSRLKNGDLRLIREAFEVYRRSGLAGSREVEMRALLKRMLRKVK
jgi:hypothetical protein